MNRAIVAVRAGSTGGDRVFLIGVKRWRFLKLLVDADDGVRFLLIQVIVSPDLTVMV